MNELPLIFSNLVILLTMNFPKSTAHYPLCATAQEIPKYEESEKIKSALLVVFFMASILQMLLMFSHLFKKLFS